jgi:hypothetical protein
VLQGADTPEASLFVNVPTTDATPYVIRVSVTDTGHNTASWAFTIFTTTGSSSAQRWEPEASHERCGAPRLVS